MYLRVRLPLVHEECPLHLRFLPVALASIELVEGHLARVRLDGDYVWVNLTVKVMQSTIKKYLGTFDQN